MMSVSLYNCGHCKLPQLVGQRCHCRTPEDEAFDELAKKQGMWGGGFQAKRAAAADKINADFDEEYKKMHEDRIKYGTSWSKNGERIDPMSVYLDEPAHSEWNAALDEAAERIGEIKGFGQATQDSFAVFIKGLKR